MSEDIRKMINKIKNIKEVVNENVLDWGKEKVASDKITPPQYVYHMSDKQNRNGIIQNGLIPSVGDSYQSWAKTDKAVPAVFATIKKDLNGITNGMENFQSDIWRIDTTKSNNEWFIDKHFEMYKNYGIKNPHIVTFSPISKNAIKLVYKQN